MMSSSSTVIKSSDTVTTAASKSGKLSATELKLYDRQIRTWGHERQEKLSKATVLFLNSDGVNTEVLKNLCLSGIGNIWLVEKGLKPTEIDVATNMFIRENDMMEEDQVSIQTLINLVAQRVREMNPYINVRLVDAKELVSERKKADVIIGSFADINSDDLGISNSNVNESQHLFLTSHVGDIGFCYTYSSSSTKYDKLLPIPIRDAVVARNQAKDPHIRTFLTLLAKHVTSDQTRKTENTLTDSDLDLKIEDDILLKSNLKAPCVTVSAVLGGVVAQEIQKAVTFSNPVLGNCIVADMRCELTVKVETVGIRKKGDSNSIKTSSDHDSNTVNQKDESKDNVNECIPNLNLKSKRKASECDGNEIQNSPKKIKLDSNLT